MSYILGFTGNYQDLVASGYPLGHGYRWLLTEVMRFNKQDSRSPFGPGGINPYAYCGADPINRSDPSGHIGIDLAEIDDDVQAAVRDLVDQVAANEERPLSQASAVSSHGEVEPIAMERARPASSPTQQEPANLPRPVARYAPGTGPSVPLLSYETFFRRTQNELATSSSRAEVERAWGAFGGLSVARPGDGNYEGMLRLFTFGRDLDDVTAARSRNNAPLQGSPQITVTDLQGFPGEAAFARDFDLDPAIFDQMRANSTRSVATALMNIPAYRRMLVERGTLRPGIEQQDQVHTSLLRFLFGP